MVLEAPTPILGPIEYAALAGSPITDERELQTNCVWICSKCTRTVEPELDLCWACGTSRDGVEDPDFQRVDDRALSQSDSGADSLEEAAPWSADGSGEEQDAEDLSVASDAGPARTCSGCGIKLVEIKLIDSSGGSGNRHEELRYTAGDAEQGWIFGFPIEGIIRAQLCPKCGRVALYALPTR